MTILKTLSNRLYWHWYWYCYHHSQRKAEAFKSNQTPLPHKTKPSQQVSQLPTEKED